jgi:hypothetical protein
MSRGRKERTPAQLAVLAQAREKAKIVIAERAKLNAHAKTVAETEPLTEDVLPPPEPEDEAPPVLEEVPPPPPPEPEPEPEEPPPPPTLENVSQPETEDEEPRLTRREVGERPSPKYHYINGMYIKIK